MDASRDWGLMFRPLPPLGMSFQKALDYVRALDWWWWAKRTTKKTQWPEPEMPILAEPTQDDVPAVPKARPKRSRREDED